MAYFNKYYLEFSDGHLANPLNYRIDILDSFGATPTEPYKLTGASPTLITTRLNENDNKQIGVIGKELTISYLYTGNPNEPVPDDFFEADERRFRVEVRINGVLDGVYYTKGDFSSAPYDSPPYPVKIKAVDGLAYAKSINFNMLQDGLILYDRIPLYEAVMTRALLQILDPDTKLYVLNSLYPTNITAGLKLFFNCYVHTDNFYDFTSGPISVFDAINIIAINFRCRIFIEENVVFIIRIQDLTYNVFSVDSYIDAATAQTITIDMLATAGPLTSNDAMPIAKGTKSSKPGYKSVQYKAPYRAINRLVNFDWRNFDGNFNFWGSAPGNDRRGTGSIEDPYRAFLPYNFSNPGDGHLQQEVPFIQTIPPTLIGPAFVGDTLELVVPWKAINVDGFSIRIRIQSNNPGSVHYLSSGGNWVPGISTFIQLKRSKRKQRASYSIKTDPIPINDFGTTNYAIFVEYYTPTGLNDFEGLEPAGVEIYPTKLGINNSSSKSFITKATNKGNYSVVNDEEPFSLFDNGDIFSANVLSVNPSGDSQIPVDNWDSDKANVSPADLEYHMTRAYIDQYSKSIKSWDGSLYGNTIKYYQLLEFTHIPGKRFMQISITFDNENCTYTNASLQEVLVEGNADIDYIEYDIEDETD